MTDWPLRAVVSARETPDPQEVEMHATSVESSPSVRLQEFADRVGSIGLARVACGAHPVTGEPLADADERSEWTSTMLMDAYRQSRDEEAIAMLFEQHRAPFLRRIRQLFVRWRPGMDEDDVLQEVFVNICRYPDNFRPDSANAFRSWSMTILRNTIVGDVRGGRRRPKPVDATEWSDAQRDMREPSPEQAAENHEQAQVVDQAYVLLLQAYLLAFDRLSHRDRELIEMVELQHLPYRQIAGRLGATESTIKVRVFRCRQRVQRAVHEVLDTVSHQAA